MSDVSRALFEVKDQYSAVHTAKEDLFWETKMGLAADPEGAQRRAADAEKAWNAFLQSPERLAALRDLEARAETDGDRAIARGWIAMLSAHVVESPEARKLSEEIV
jgi:hypothetical protein